ncbi:MAG: O-antigen ligase family protein [Eubacteriales bacterium]|nr:O-antigen ligase family protein [Eubacteriales bacterium]
MAKKYSSANKPVSDGGQSQDALESSSHHGWFGIIITALFIFILTLAGSMDSIVEKWTGLASAIILLLLLLISKKTSVLKEYITPLFYAFLAYILWGGISTFYAASGKFAIFEFSKLLVALCVYIAVLFFTSRDQFGFNRVSLILASTGCFFGIISVDAASSGILAKAFKAFFGIFTDSFIYNGAFEQGIRITGIFGNPNTYAGFMALAVILSLYLVTHASGKKDTIISAGLLAINALSYLLAFSMGSLFMFFIACLIMIGTTEKGKRISLFLLMMETAILTFIFAFISMIGLGKTGIVGLTPLLALLLNAFSLYHLDQHLRPALSRKLNENIKLLYSTVIIIVVVVIGYTVSALMISSDMSLNANENISRSIYVPGGEYSLSLESSAPVSLIIESQNEYDLMRHTSTILYTGASEQPAAFTVPDDSQIVQIQFIAAGQDTEIYNAEYKGAEDGNVHLDYPLLPNIIANRIQNLFANENVVQRTIFFEDGIEIFSKSPVIGRGLGGFENGVYSVQDFYYETKYAHNHYIQVLSDLGIIGFIIFISILVSSVAAIVKAKRKSLSLFAVPALAACIVQIFGQALTDAVWSTGVFLGFSAAILALITVFCAEPLKLKETFNRDRLGVAEKAVLVVFTGIFIILLSGNLYSQAHAKAGVKDFKEIERLILLDRFEHNDYKLSYIVNAPKSNSEEVLQQSQIYSEQLSKAESNSLAPYIMDYEFKIYHDSDAIDAAKSGIANNKSNPGMWIRMFDVLEEHIDPVGPNVDDAADRLRSPEYYIKSVIELYNMLQERNASSLDDIMLTPSNNAFIGKCLEIETTHLYSVDWVFTAIMTYAFDSVCAVDANQDGLPDSLSVVAGSAQGKDLGVISVSDNTVLDFNLYHKLRGKYTFKIEAPTPQGIMISYNGQEQDVIYTNDEAYVMIDLQNNSDQLLSKFTVTLPTAAELDAITFTTKLE